MFGTLTRNPETQSPKPKRTPPVSTPGPPVDSSLGHRSVQYKLMKLKKGCLFSMHHPECCEVGCNPCTCINHKGLKLQSSFVQLGACLHGIRSYILLYMGKHDIFTPSLSLQPCPGIKTMIGLKLYEISIAAFQQPWEFGQRLTNLPYGRRFAGAKVTSLSLLWDPSLDRSVPPDGNCQLGQSGSMCGPQQVMQSKLLFLTSVGFTLSFSTFTIYCIPFGDCTGDIQKLGNVFKSFLAPNILIAKLVDALARRGCGIDKCHSNKNKQ